MPYRFTKSISVERTLYKAGHVVADDVLPKGTIRSMLRLRQIEHVDELPEAAGSVEIGGDELQPKPEKQKAAAKPKKAAKQTKPSEPIEPSAESPETPSPAEPETDNDNQ